MQKDWGFFMKKGLALFLRLLLLFATLIPAFAATDAGALSRYIGHNFATGSDKSRSNDYAKDLFGAFRRWFSALQALLKALPQILFKK